ncbi:MAG TPA: hypothetical protein VLL76_09075 [Candidatus Omnitrophota bacterium]|nr:hypothetical protein [Candidatus Omnitrophota bacterium]
MFDATGFHCRDDHHDECETIDPTAAPLDHVVLKDGRPFAILNATPALAEYALAGFVQATPGSQWTLARC